MIPDLPVGWRAEDFGEVLLIKSPQPFGCVVTIDFEQRCFRGGWSLHSDKNSTKTYSGRGWRQQLVNDAVTWLQEIVNS